MRTFKMKLQISQLDDTGDRRAFSFALPPQALEFLGRVRDLYSASTARGAIQGNHYHWRRREAIILLPGTRWSLHWDDGEGTPKQHGTSEWQARGLGAGAARQLACRAQ
jgi:hypothetical protein